MTHLFLTELIISLWRRDNESKEKIIKDISIPVPKYLIHTLGTRKCEKGKDESRAPWCDLNWTLKNKWDGCLLQTWQGIGLWFHLVLEYNKMWKVLKMWKEPQWHLSFDLVSASLFFDECLMPTSRSRTWIRDIVNTFNLLNGFVFILCFSVSCSFCVGKMCNYLILHLFSYILSYCKSNLRKLFKKMKKMVRKVKVGKKNKRRTKLVYLNTQNNFYVLQYSFPASLP